MIPRDMVLRMLDKIRTRAVFVRDGFSDVVARKRSWRGFWRWGWATDVNEKILYGNFMKLFDLHDEDETEGA